jgi:hypothetical protein
MKTHQTADVVVLGAQVGGIEPCREDLEGGKFKLVGVNVEKLLQDIEP